MNLDVNLKFEGGYLKPLLISDVHLEYVEGLNNIEINRYLDGVKNTSQTIESVSNFVQHNLDSENSVLFGIWLDCSSEHCGTVRIHSIEHSHHTAHIGICIFDKSAWGKAVGSKAIRVVSTWALDTFKLRWIEAGAYAQNVASQKAFLSAGYHWVFDIPNKYLFDGVPSIVKVYAFGSAVEHLLPD